MQGYFSSIKLESQPVFSSFSCLLCYFSYFRGKNTEIEDIFATTILSVRAKFQTFSQVSLPVCVQISAAVASYGRSEPVLLLHEIGTAAAASACRACCR